MNILDTHVHSSPSSESIKCECSANFSGELGIFVTTRCLDPGVVVFASERRAISVGAIPCMWKSVSVHGLVERKV